MPAFCAGWSQGMLAHALPISTSLTAALGAYLSLSSTFNWSWLNKNSFLPFPVSLQHLSEPKTSSLSPFSGRGSNYTLRKQVHHGSILWTPHGLLHLLQNHCFTTQKWGSPDHMDRTQVQEVLTKISFPPIIHTTSQWLRVPGNSMVTGLVGVKFFTFKQHKNKGKPVPGSRLLPKTSMFWVSYGPNGLVHYFVWLIIIMQGLLKGGQILHFLPQSHIPLHSFNTTMKKVTLDSIRGVSRYCDTGHTILKSPTNKEKLAGWIWENNLLQWTRNARFHWNWTGDRIWLNLIKRSREIKEVKQSQRMKPKIGLG